MIDSSVIVAMDIGHDTIRVLIGEVELDGTLRFSGWGSHPSTGIQNGIIVNIEATRESILVAVEAAEMMAGRTVREICMALGGSSMNSFHSEGSLPVPDKSREISQIIIDRVHDNAKAVLLPSDCEILHLLPKDYTVDGQSGIRDPLNRLGVRLKSNVLIITVALAAVNTMKMAVERAGYQVCDTSYGTLAASYSVLNQDEKDMGVLLINIGAHATDFILIKNRMTQLTGSIPVGGYFATSDISYLLNISMATAEHLKCEMASCWQNIVDVDKPVFVPGIGGSDSIPTRSSELVRILEPRMEELFCLIRRKVDKLSEINRHVKSVVLIGGGALLNGADGLAGQVFKVSARVGRPKVSLNLPEECRDPRWTTVAGLIQKRMTTVIEENRKKPTDNAESRSFFTELRRWFEQFF